MRKLFLLPSSLQQLPTPKSNKTTFSTFGHRSWQIRVYRDNQIKPVMASQLFRGSSATSSPFGGFSTSTPRQPEDTSSSSLPSIPSQPYFHVVSASQAKLYNPEVALLAPGTSQMASVVTLTSIVSAIAFLRHMHTTLFQYFPFAA